LYALMDDSTMGFESVTHDGIVVRIGSHEGKLIFVASDHRGFEYKNAIVKHLEDKGYQAIDLGTNSAERCDYPAISETLAQSIEAYYRAGIGICGSGIGILIPASRYKSIYAARCVTPADAETSRKHNNSNLLGIGADVVDLETALKIVDTWLTTPFYSDPETEGAYLNRFVQTIKLARKIR